MILRRFGSRVASVVPRFDSRALNEIGFTRTDTFDASREEFDQEWERVTGSELGPKADGDVQDAVERELLEKLRSSLIDLESAMRPDEVLLVENEIGKDHPKTRGTKRMVIVAGESRHHFDWRVDPPLKVGVYRRR